MLFNNNNGQDGIMFTITAKQDIVIDSFSNHHWAGLIPEYRIYYKCGDATSATTNAGAWTLIGSAFNVTSAGAGSGTMIPINVNVPINAYQTVAFYLTTTGGNAPITRYTNGTGVCDSLGGNPDLILHQGYGKDYPFGATFSPRSFNGEVFYHCTSNPAPSLVGNFSFCEVQVGQQETYVLSPPPPAGCGDPKIAWVLPSNMSIISGAQNDTVVVQFNDTVATGTICAALLGCDNSDTVEYICQNLLSQPPVAEAGPDSTICSETYQLQGNMGSGYWEVLSGAGVLADPSQFNTTVSGLSIGANTFRWNVGGGGCPFSSDEVTITVNPLPVAQFNPYNVCDLTGVNFEDSSYALGGNIIGWNWNVDGDTTFDYSTNQFTHTYTGPGTYDATLVVTASQGCTDTVTHPITVNPNPVAEFFYEPDCEGVPVSFRDTSTILSGSIQAWQWEFGDGTAPGFAQHPGHVYQGDGLYMVTFTVTSDKGCENTVIDTAEVYSIPDVDFGAEEVCQHDTVFFRDSSISVQGVVNYWDWDFGDGAPTVQQQDTAHFYVAHGTYFVRLTVATDRGCTNTVVKPHRSFPVPVPNYSQEGVCEEQEVFFNDESSVDPMFGSTLVGYDWAFGDGDSASNERVGHYYQDPGEYVLGHTPITNYGCTTTYEYDILIRPRPRANAVVLDDEVCAGNVIRYTDQTFFDPTYDSTGVVSWQWYFGDGKSSVQRNPKNTFSEGGDYRTVMIVETGYGCIDSSVINTMVYHNPIADFRPDTLEGCSPHCVTFIDNSTIATEEDLAYAWSFGDGVSNVLDVNPTHCYEVEDGSGLVDFPVDLVVASAEGCTDSFRMENRVRIHARPIADFDLSAGAISLLDSVVFIDDFSVGADYWMWDFGDSSTSSSSAPMKHVYNEPGLYEIQLTVADNFGCDDSAVRRLLVERHQTLYVPSSFSPNGDGLNDVFQIEGEDYEFVRLWIFNRWGDQIFYGENDNAKWDGTQNGRVLGLGSYPYIIEYRPTGQITQQLKGNIIISKSQN
jgi:gliding motility-associated-like protein